MSTDSRYVEKLMAIVGPDRSRHSPEEIGEAEAELKELAKGSLKGDSRETWNLREKGLREIAITVGLAAVLGLALMIGQLQRSSPPPRTVLPRPRVQGTVRPVAIQAKRPLPPPSSSTGSIAGPSSGTIPPSSNAILVFKRLVPPRSGIDVDEISGSLPLPRSDVGAAPAAAHPFILAVPGGKTATSLRAAIHPVSETGFTWGEAAVYVQYGDSPPVFAGRLAASLVRTGNQVLELKAPAPFTQALFYPLDCSGSFYQSSLDLEWVEFR